MANARFTRGAESGDMPSAELLRECGLRLTDQDLWAEFQRRFQRLIFLYLLRACRVSRGGQPAIQDVLPDLAQDVYLRLIQDGGHMLRSFRGGTDFAVRALLARVASSVVADHLRYQAAGKRQAQVISIEEARETIERSGLDGAGIDPESMASLLSWIDVQRVLKSDEDRRNAARNLLIFKLHYIDGFTARELASFPGFNLSVSGIEAVLNKIRMRIRR